MRLKVPGNRLHTPAEVRLGRKQTYHQPPLPGKAKETAGVDHDSSLQQELERCLLFRLQPWNPQHSIPTRLDFKPRNQCLM
jgi:hypothetical protein